MKRLTQLDHLQNLEEFKIPKEYEQQLKKLLANDFSIEYYKGFHNVARSYLKTLQWVMYYYLSPKGVPQWDWEYPYPFTPLCSDMGVYCQLYDSKHVLNQLEDYTKEELSVRQQKKQKDVEDDEESSLETQIYRKQATMDERDLEERIAAEYDGPKFKFVLGKPKS